jgi:hypothetical protein
MVNDESKLSRGARFLAAISRGWEIARSHAEDQVADMKTNARDSIIRGAIFGAVIGMAFGAWLFA